MDLGSLAGFAGPIGSVAGGLLLGPVGAVGGGILGNMLGGMGKKSQPSGGNLSPLNPSFNSLLGLFGQKMGVHGHGSDAGQVYFARNKKNPGIFGNLQSSISDFMNNPVGLYGGEQGVTQGLLEGNQLQNLLGQTTGGLDQLLNSNGGYQTGFRTSAAPIYQEGIRNFNQNILPSIAEMLGPQVGLRSQSFVDAAAREGANLMGQASLRDTELAEAAAGRIPMAAQLLQTRGATPLAFANDTLSFGNSLRNLLESNRSRPLQVFQQLSGMAGPGSQGFLQQGYNPQGSGQASQMSGLASSLGNLSSQDWSQAGTKLSSGLSSLGSFLGF